MAKIILSAQNFDIYEGDELNAFARTGSTSVEQLQRAGAEGVIIGHSEAGDSPDVVHKKLLTVSRKNLLLNNTVLVGETWEEFERGSNEEIADVIAQQTRVILEGIAPQMLQKLVLGYEPKWGSQGSGRDDQPPPSPELVGICAQRMKTVLADMGAGSVPVIYGGRSTPERTEAILSDPDVEGLILGSACSSLQRMLEIADAMTRAKGKGRKILHANFKAYNLSDSYEKYVDALSALDESFVIYLSPPHTDIRLVRSLLEEL